MECIIKKSDGSTIQMTDTLLRHQVAAGAVGRTWAARPDSANDWSTVEAILGLGSAAAEAGPTPVTPTPPVLLQPVIRKRPTGVTIVSWILIVLSALNLLVMFVAAASPNYDAALAKNHWPVAFQKVIGFVGLVVTLLSGVFMLKGAGWARWLYIGWSGVGGLLMFWNIGFTPLVIPGLVKYAVFTAVLLQKKSSDFFSRQQ